MDVKIGLRARLPRGQRLLAFPIILLALALCGTGQGKSIVPMETETDVPCPLGGCDCSLPILRVICKDTFNAANQPFAPPKPALIRCNCSRYDFRESHLVDITSLQNDCQELGYYQIELRQYCALPRLLKDLGVPAPSSKSRKPRQTDDEYYDPDVANDNGIEYPIEYRRSTDFVEEPPSLPQTQQKRWKKAARKTKGKKKKGKGKAGNAQTQGQYEPEKSKGRNKKKGRGRKKKTGRNDKNQKNKSRQNIVTEDGDSNCKCACTKNKKRLDNRFKNATAGLEFPSVDYNLVHGGVFFEETYTSCKCTCAPEKYS